MTTIDEVATPATSDAIGVVGPPHGARRRLTVNQVVALAVLLGVASVTFAFISAGTTDGYFRLHWMDPKGLLVSLVALTCAAELVAVRMRHEDDAVEELTLLDGVVLLSTLLLPLEQAVLVSLSGILLAYLIRRRDVIKVLYNLGVYASASTATALLVHAIAPMPGAFGLRLLVAMAAGTAAFVATNLAYMSLLLNALSGMRPRQVVREDAPLALLTVMGTIALTGTVLAISVTAPLLLPCTVLPAAALWYAYGASVAKHEERRRSSRVLEYSQILATGPSRSRAIEALLELLHLEFEASTTLAIFHDDTVVEFEPGGRTLRQLSMTGEHRTLLKLPALGLIDPGLLPTGWQTGIVAPVVVDGQPIGTVAIGSTGRSRLRPRDLTTVSPLVGSLAVALQNADYMARLFEETSKLRAVVDQASDGIVVLGRQGVIEVWSPSMERITGIGAERAVGHGLVDVLVAEDIDETGTSPLTGSLRRLSRESPQVDVDVRLMRPDGERRAARFSHAAAFEGSVMVRDVVIVHDLTAEWQVQRMKEDFIATVSHELRTPLTPIKGYAGMLRKRGDSMPPEKRARALDVIVDRAEHLGRLVEDLLAASSVTADGPPKHSMDSHLEDLVALTHRVCEDFATGSSRVQLDCPSGPVWVVCDPTRVVQVASNLVSNALKYSEPHSQIVVTVDALEGLGRLTVEDRGRGIPADQLERIFDKFHRVEDPMVMSTGGTGLGLYIARQLARAMGGDVIVQSTFGVGSRFTVTLPQPVDGGQAAAAQ